MSKERTTRRGRLLTLFSQDGRATYRLWHTLQYTLRFYLCGLFYQGLTTVINRRIMVRLFTYLTNSAPHSCEAELKYNHM